MANEKKNGMDSGEDSSEGGKKKRGEKPAKAKKTWFPTTHKRVAKVESLGRPKTAWKKYRKGGGLLSLKDFVRKLYGVDQTHSEMVTKIESWWAAKNRKPYADEKIENAARNEAAKLKHERMAA